MLTMKEISEKNNIKMHVLYERAKRYEVIHNKKIAKAKYYDNNKVNLLIKKRDKFCPSETLKLKVIEYYLMFNRQPKRTTALELGIPYKYLSKVLKEWRENNNCVIIKSKL